jgi:hypothetical protein
MFSNLFSITLPNIGKYFPGIHFPRNSLSKKKLLSSKQRALLLFSFLFNLCIQQYAIKENLQVVSSEQQTSFLLKKPLDDNFTNSLHLEIIELATYWT